MSWKTVGTLLGFGLGASTACSWVLAEHETRGTMDISPYTGPKFVKRVSTFDASFGGWKYVNSPSKISLGFYVKRNRNELGLNGFEELI